jgi:hypothetical protein
MARTSQNDNRSAELLARVQKALLHYGCAGIVAEIVDGRTIKLSGVAKKPDDKAFAVAVVRTVPGVSAVALDVRDGVGDGWRTAKP